MEREETSLYVPEDAGKPSPTADLITLEDIADYLDRRRQVILNELGLIEDIRGIPRTKPPKGGRKKK